MRKMVKIFRSFLSCVLLTGVFMMPAAKAGTTVVYLERSWDGTKVVTTQTTRRDVPAFPDGTTVAGGWYFLDRDVTVNGRLSLQDDTHLILGSQKTLDVKGLYIPQGRRFTSTA